MDASKILMSDELDILFDGRNKKYGAYDLRKTYNDRLVMAMLITLGCILVVYIVPFIIPTKNAKQENEFVLKDVSLSQVKEPDKALPPPPPAPPKLPPPPANIETVKFTAPKIVKDNEVPKDVKPPEIAKIAEAKISTVNQAGSKDAGIIVPAVAPPVESKGTQVVAKPVEDNYVFTKVEKQAEFPGGDVQWRHYLEKNLNANVPVDNNAPEGAYTVVVKFIVSSDGSISDVQAMTNFGYGMETEAVNVIKNGPRWIPAIQNGRTVNAYRLQPITFVIHQE